MVQRLSRAAARAAAVALMLSGVAASEPVTSLGPSPVDAATTAPAPVADPAWLVDPWLTDVGPPLAAAASASSGIPASAGATDRIVQAWRSAPPTPHARSAALRRLRLEYGLGDLRAPAEIVRTGVDEDDPEMGTALARALAPNMPALGWAHVQDLWRAGAAGEAARAFAELLRSTAGDLESQLWVVGNGLLFTWIVALATTSAFIVLLALKAFPHAAHDLGDPLSRAMPGFARAALLAGLMMVPLALGEGLAGLVLACFAVAVVHGTGRERSALVLAAIVWVVAVHPLARWASIAATVAEADPIVRGAWAVTQGTASPSELERLETAAGDDVVAGHALAYRARRLGLSEVAARRLEALAERDPTDPVVLANRGNLEMRAGRIEAAIELYERAAAQLDSPDLLFDLSQAYASVLRMEESELALVRAQRIADGEVAALSSLSDAKLVADLAYPVDRLRARLREAAVSQAPASRSTRWIAPGRLGQDWKRAGGAFGLVALIALFTSGRFERASTCTRCGHRVCRRCDGTIWGDELCDDCHHLFKNPDATDPKLRMARLQVLARREAWQGRLLGLGSIVVPGVAGLAARRPDVALLSIALFVWIAAIHRWPAGLLVDSSWLGGLASLLTSTIAVVALASYGAIVVGSFVVRRNR